MSRRRDNDSVMPRRMSASGPGRTDDDRNEDGTSDLAVTARKGITLPVTGRARAWGTIRPAPSAGQRDTVSGGDRHHEEPHNPMTARPSKPTSRPRTWDDRERRNMLLNIGFGLTIVAALLLLLIAWGASWYNDHLAAAGTVNGTTITRDAWAKQVQINEFRADYQNRRIRTLLAAGHIGAADAELRTSVISQRLAQVDALSLEQLIDGTLQANLATEKGISVTPADVDAGLKQEATIPELRHAWVIEVKPETDEGTSTPTDAQVAAAKAKADQALADLKAGQDWETVAKAVSTAASKEQAGDLGFIDENTALDSLFRDAILAVAQDTPTDVVAGTDDIFRIGRVTEIIAPVEDATFEQQVTDWGISMDDFRGAVQRDVTRVALNDAIVAEVLAPGPQREVAEIFIEASANESVPSAVRTRHILYSPNDDPQGAADVAEDDPAWDAAEAEARATHEKLKADISQFDAIARAESDEGLARTTGGKLNYYGDDGSLDESFGAAIFAEGLEEGDLLEPVKTDFGWHVIQILNFPTDDVFVGTLRARIAAGELTFAEAARDHSFKAEAANGGDIGWVGKGQLAEDIETAIFSAPIGEVSPALIVDGEGIYLFFVSKEETRAPDAEQRASLESSAFSIWYSRQKATAEIERDPVITGGL